MELVEADAKASKEDVSQKHTTPGIFMSSIYSFGRTR